MAKKNNTKTKVLSALFWKLMERGGTQGIQFVVQIMLARLLLPKDYGLIALVTIFITLATVFVQSGFNAALIQKKDADEIDFSSVYYLSLIVAGLLYIILFITAPFIADFYREPQFVTVLRVLAATLIFGAINSIQNAFVARNMMFKKLFFSSLGAMLISGTAGILTAYAGWGVWALVVQQLANQLSITIILWFTVKWRPIFAFSITKVKGLFSYGSKLLGSSLLETLYKDSRSIIIGKIYTPATLGFYTRGQHFPSLIVTNINGSIKSVMLPALSAHQDNKMKVKNMMRRSIVTSSFIMFPMMVGLGIVAEPLIKLVLTDKWLPAVPFLRIFCASYALWPIHTANLQAINALGRSDIFLKLEILKRTVGLIILIISIRYGIFAIALGELLSGIIASFINAYPNLKLLNYSYSEQWKDITPSLLLSLVMGVAVYSINFIYFHIWIKLIVQILLGLVLYVGMSFLSKNENLMYLLNTLKQFFQKKNYKHSNNDEGSKI